MQTACAPHRRLNEARPTEAQRNLPLSHTNVSRFHCQVPVDTVVSIFTQPTFENFN